MTILYDVVGKQQLMSKEEDREAVVREEEDIPAYIPGRQKEWKPEPPLPNNACRKHTSVGKAMTVAVAVADLLKCNPRSDGDRSFLDILNDSSEENDIVDIVQAI
ncbi:Cell surface hyaluronidase [Trichinella pseudospiralis]